MSAACSPSDYAALSGAALVNELAGGTGTCLGTLWSFDGDVATVIAATNVTAVAAEIETLAADVAANAVAITNLAYFYQIAFFHEFYQSEVTYDESTFDAARQALVAVAASPYLLSESAEAGDLRSQWTTSIDSTNGTHLAIATIQALLERYQSDPALGLEYQERVIAFGCLFTIARQIGNNYIELGVDSPWYGLVPQGLIDVMEAIALDLDYTDDTQSITENAIYALSHFVYLDAATAEAGHEILSNAFALFPQHSGPWFRALVDLDWFFGAELADGSVLDVNQIRADVAAVALPNEYVFDQGRLIFKTAIDLAKAEELYDAMQEVESQFFRKTTFLDAVSGDDNEILTLIVYGSPADYGLYQPFLYGLSTANGGIFIESMGTLFTYDRTPEESIYTLEELLRHEYVHYLDARYVITGSFGDPGSLYDGDRMVWYNEGLAEFLVGSTRVEGVLPRAGLLEQIESDPARLTVADITEATYSDGFLFYRYAGMFFEFLDSQRPGLLRELFDAVRSNDKGTLDALYASFAADAQLQSDYDVYLSAQIAAMNAGSGLFAEDVPTTYTPAVIPENNSDQLYDVLMQQLPTDMGSFAVWTNRFSYSDELTIPSTGLTSAQVNEAYEAELDGVLAALTPLGANLESAVAWFGNTVSNGSFATATYVVEGPYNATASDVNAPDPPSGLMSHGGTGTVYLEWTANSETDLAAYNVYRSETSGGPYDKINESGVTSSRFNDGSVGAGVDYYYVVTATDASGNESELSAEVADGSATSVLLVNGYFDDGNTGYVEAYADALEALGYGYDYWDPFTRGEIPAEVLLNYADGLVVWAVGYFHPGYPDQLDDSRRQVLRDYLEAGGSLVLSGAYTASNLDQTPLFTDYVQVQFVNNGTNLPGLSGVPADVVGEGLELTMGNLGYQSEIDPIGTAVTALTYDPASGAGAVSSSGTAVAIVDMDYRVAFMAFPFADLVSDSREQLLGSAVTWMSPLFMGDINDDGSISAADALDVLSAAVGQTGICMLCVCDVNDDGVVSASDAFIVLQYAVGMQVVLATPTCS